VKFVIPTPTELQYGLRALKTIGLADGPLQDTQRAVLVTAQQMFGGKDLDIDSLEPITGKELAEHVTEPATRFQLLGGMLVICMADGDVADSEAKVIGHFADALGIEDSATKNLNRLAHGHFRHARLDILRRQWAVRKVRAMAAQEGVGVYFKAILGLLRLREDPAMIEKYRAFEHYPQGSLGRAYFDYIIGNGFSFPGERGAPPEAMLFHDFSHILSGYSTEPEGEIQVASFSAGYSTVEVHNWLMFVLSQFQLGLQTAPNVPPETMKMDSRSLLIAFRRGAAMNMDINVDWDFWPELDKPVEALRKKYNIVPLDAFDSDVE